MIHTFHTWIKILLFFLEGKGGGLWLKKMTFWHKKVTKRKVSHLDITFKKIIIKESRLTMKNFDFEKAQKYLLQKASRFPPLPLADIFRASLTRTWRAPLKEMTGAGRNRDSKLRSLGTYFKARNSSPL